MATTPLEEANPGLRVERPGNVPEDRVFDVDVYNLDGLDDGYHEAWMRLKKPDTPSLIWTPLTGGHWIATDADTIREVYADYTRFSNEVMFVPKAGGERYQLIPARMDPPEHTPYRRALDRALNPAQVRRAETKIREIAAELIDGFVDRGECVFTEEYASLFPVRVFMALTNLPLEDAPKLSVFARQLTRPEGATPEEKAADLARGNDGFFAYVEPIIAERWGGNGDDMITTVLNTQVDGGNMAQDKALGLISTLLLGGLDTVVNFLNFIMIHLGQHPELVEELRSDRLTLMRGVEELFRRFPVVSDARMVAKDIEYRGVHLKKGDMIAVPGAMAGLDESRNPDPWKVDLKRRKMSHATFAEGPHRCPGMHLARLEVIITLEEWLKRIPHFRFREDIRPTYSSGIIAAVENVHLYWNEREPA